MLISHTHSKLLIAALTLSVNFTSHIHAMESLFLDCTTLNNDWSLASIDNVEPFSIDDSFSDYGYSLLDDGDNPFIDRKLFSNNSTTQMYEKFLQAVYNQDNVSVQQLICSPALEYLKTHFRATRNDAQKIWEWALKNRYDGIFRNIMLAITAPNYTPQEELVDDFWGDWGF